MIDRLGEFIDTYTRAINNENAAVFAGAGLSIPAGMVDWKSLMHQIARDVGLDVKKEDDLVALAQYHANRRGGRHKINQALVSEFSSRARSTANHTILASLPIRTYWTTNYDHLIEQSLDAAGKKPDVKRTVANLAITVPMRDAVVYKMHGDADHPDQAVITKDDYETYESSRQLFSTALQGDLVSKTFLFVGFSFNDPNLNYILSRIRILLGANRREHFALLRRVQKSDFQKSRDFRYAQAKQDLQVEDLGRYGIIGVLVDDYREYTKVLQRVSNRYRRSKIFVSGSADTYAPWSTIDAEELATRLGRELIGHGFGVVSGLGKGISPYLVNGALDEIHKKGTRQFSDHLILRPFPQSISNPAERRDTWTRYRKEMIAEAGIAIFLFGNKVDARGNTADAAGVKEEFDLAVAAGLAVIPVGCTGYISSRLHKQVVADFKNFFPEIKGIKATFKELADSNSPKTIVRLILTLVDKIKEG